MKTSLKRELLKAKANHYAVPAFNFDNLEMLKAIIAAAEEEHSPVILMVTESAAKYIGVDYVYAIGQVAVQTSKVPVVLHWDHGSDLNLIKQAIDHGFTSVMLDASQKSFSENVKLTQEIVTYAHQKGVEVEAEIGHVGGKEDDRDSLNQGFTDWKEAKEFFDLTNVDALAIAVGTSHGLYKGKVNLQYDLIKQINQTVDVPLVLHGSSGIPLTDLQKAISEGISKINIGTDLKVANANSLKNWFNQYPQQFDARKFGNQAIEEVKQIAIEKIQAFGSNNQIKLKETY